MKEPKCPKCGEPMPDAKTWGDVYDFRCLTCHEQTTAWKPRKAELDLRGCKR